MRRQAVGHLGHGVLAISPDEVGERCEQRGIGEHLGLDAVMQRLLPRSRIYLSAACFCSSFSEARGIRRGVGNSGAPFC